MAKAKKKEITNHQLEILNEIIAKAHEALHIEKAEHEKTKAELRKFREDFFNLQSLYRKENGKSVPVNLKPLVQIELENEIKWLKAETVSINEFEREKFSKEQYMRLLDEEKRKYNELRECLKTHYDISFYQTQIDALTEKIKEFKRQLQEEKEKHNRKGTGRKRNNNTPDEEILRLRAEGQTIKAIHSLTGISTATINRILTKFKTLNP